MAPPHPSQGSKFTDYPGISNPGEEDPVLDVLSRLAREGIVGRERALEAGISDGALEYRLARGGLHRMFDGIYCVGHKRTDDLAWFFAALEAAGEDARISHLSALRYWRLLLFDLMPIHITLPRGRLCRRKGIEPHRPVDQHPWDYADIDGLRIASVQRAILDSAPMLTDKQLALIVHKARVEHRISLESIKRTIDRAPKARGAKRLHVVAFGKQLPPGRLERRLMTIVKRAGLPDYERNVFVDGVLVDAYWREQDLIYEVDDPSHLTSHRHAKDIQQTNRLQDNGHTVRRVTEEDLYPRAKETIANLRAQLEALSR